MRNRALARRSPGALGALVVSAALAALVVTGCSAGGDGDTDEAPPPSGPAPSGRPAAGLPGVTLPPVRAGFDYQLGAPYDPPPGVSVVARDHTAPPAPGVYNICYINAFQAQPGAEKDWDPDLLLRDASGAVVMDKDWGEAMLDVRTDDKRRRIAQKMYGWIDECAAKGYQAVDPDNYDTYTRAPKGLLTAADAKAFLALLAAHAHERKLAVGQKNTPELAPARKEVGVDFAVVEECGQYDECADYAAAFGDDMIVIEYTDQGMRRACRGWGDKVSIVRRDLRLVPDGTKGYHHATCAAVK
ncbi:endo alpha-1,4 polygalactosaminidase [Streptomyces antimicrobicus]|uniref:Endo alpha-1,4 polygalactosaminidase n=1 Tax=Streptomyces antimicrobicus TaxID=2883108 RepID=A0ABS8BBA7_9ACTN|nr:endo alpha-1,4 polygalactosaminidase [Streptomyces antimicrobicus]MCB5181918.1 endo alpha-1,4 polygalactosaminidase [Streptomyces antimicrobicus]